MSICVCLSLFIHLYEQALLCIHLTQALLFSSQEEIFNTAREQFKRFILYGVVIISVPGLKYFYCTGIKNFTSVGFYQMYSRGFINLKFYDTCSDLFSIIDFTDLVFFWLLILLSLKPGKDAFDNVAYYLVNFCNLIPLKYFISL